jgi:hypothetical protein
MGQFTGDGNTGLLCAQHFNGVAGQIHRSTNFNVHLPLARWGAAASAPQAYRLFRLQYTFCLQAPVVASAPIGSALNVTTFVGFTNNGAAGPAAPGNCYMGLALGQDGSWHWVTRQQAILFGLVEDVPAVIPAAAATTPTLVDWVILAANAGSDARLLLYLNGNYSSPAISRSWGPGTTLPGYHSAGAATATGFVFMIACDDAAISAVVQLGGLRWSLGHYLPTGAEVF